MIFLGKEVKTDSPMPYIVAEISCNHCGDIDRAYAHIDAAKAAGADAVKIQCYDADSMTLPTDFKINGTEWHGRNLYELYMESATPFDWIPKLFEKAKESDISIFSSVYDERGLEILVKAGCRAFKIASYEANDINFIQKVIACGKPVILSTGTLNSIELERALEILPVDSSVVLHCVSKYPTALEESAFGDMVSLMRNYEMPIGFSCHTDDLMSPLLAAHLGAAMIELHFTLDDEKAKESNDFTFSYTPDQLSYLKDVLAEMRRAMYLKGNQDRDAKKLRRSLFVVKDMKEGELFTADKVKSYRPNLGCDPIYLNDIVGKRCNQDIKKYTPMNMEFVR